MSKLDNISTLVTGANGFIGRRVRHPGDRGLVRTSRGIDNDAIGDLLDPQSLADACRGIDAIFHCAGYAHAFSSSDPSLHWLINYEGTRNLLNAAVNAGVQKFIFLSSVKAMAEPGDECVDEYWPGEPNTPYGKAKRAAEQVVLDVGAKHGMHVVNLRLTMVYGGGSRGNLERMARGISAGWFPPLPQTRNRRSLVHVDDVVAVMRVVAEDPRANQRTYIVADPQPYSGREIFDTIRVALNKPPTHLHIPQRVLRAGGTVGDAMSYLLGHQFPVNSEIVDRLLGSACYSTNLIQNELGWKAKIRLSEGVREMLGWL